MYKFQNSNLANLAIQRAAVRASSGLAALLVDLLANLRSAEVVDKRSSQIGEKLLSFRLLEQYATTVLLLIISILSSMVEVE